MSVLSFLGSVFDHTIWVLYDGALFILVGFVISGAIHVLLDPGRIVRHLGERSLRSAGLAALLGAPLPLCSCGVLPTAVSLRRRGASREATLSFLVTTPETGIDSLAMTLAYFGPVVTAARLVAAVATGLIASAVSLRHEEPDPTTAVSEVPTAHEHADAKAGPESPPASASLLERARMRVRLALRYAFRDLFDELGFWLAFAILLTAVLSAVLPSDFFARLLPSSVLTMTILAVLGVPLYVCASASTPLAALFVAKGASAGAALVFLLVGPATNAATLATIPRLFGARFLRVYLGAIVGVAFVAGLLFDLAFPEAGSSVRIGAPSDGDALLVPKTVAALVLAALIGASLRRTGVRAGISELVGNVRAIVAWVRRLGLRGMVLNPVAAAIAGLWVASVLAAGFTRVPPGHRAVVQRFGAVAGVHEPGLVYTVPLVDRVELVRTDEVQGRAIGYTTTAGSLLRAPTPDEALHLTADENVIDLHVEIQYRAVDPVRYALHVERPAQVLSALVRSRLIEAMAVEPIDLVYTNGRADLETRLLGRVRADVARIDLGVDVIAVRLLDVHAPAQVHDAFRDVASAHEDRLTTIHLATEYAVGTVALARGEARRAIVDAQAFTLEREARAGGDAEAFRALAAEHARAPQLMEDRLILETAERVLAGARKIVRATGDAPTGFELWIRGQGAPQLLPTPTESSPRESP